MVGPTFGKLWANCRSTLACSKSLAAPLANEPFANEDPAMTQPVIARIRSKLEGFHRLPFTQPFANSTISQRFSKTTNDGPTNCTT